MAKVIALFDAFTTKDTTKWYWESNASVSAGQLRLIPNSAYGKIGTNTTYDLSGSSATIRLVQLPNVGNGSIQTTFILSLGASQDLGFNIANRTVELWGSGAASIPYNATNHAWLRVREAGGTVYWETSADGIDWQQRASRATPFAITALNVTISAGYSGTEGSPGVAIYDNFNLPPAASLVDDFNSADTTKWVFPASATVASGRLQLVPTSSYGAVYSVGRYDLTGSSYGMNVVQAPNIGNGGIGLFLSVDAGSSNSLQFTIEGTGLNFRSTVGGTPSNTSITFDPAAHRYLRIREASGTIYWETSPDRTTWTSRRTLANPFAVTSCNLQVSAGYFGTEPSPGVAVVDKVNVYGVPAANILALYDDFATKDTTKWTWSANTSVASGQLRLIPNSSQSSIYSNNIYDLTGSSATVKIVSLPDVGNGSINTYFFVSSGIGNDIGFLINNGSLILANNVANVPNDTYLNYDPTAHRWLRVRESSNQIFWEASVDSITWKVLQQRALQIDVTALRVNFAALIWGTEPIPGVAIFDNFNLPKAASLSDHFKTADTSKWTFGSNTTVSTEQLRSIPSATYGAAISNSRYDFTDSFVKVEVIQRSNQGNNTTEGYFTLVSSVLNSSIEMLVTGTNIVCRQNLNGTQNDTYVTYNATTHRWWRIREQAGTVYWETSPDGGTWTVRRSLAAGFSLTALTINLGAGYYGTEPSPGTIIFDNLSLAPTSTISDNFSSADTVKWGTFPPQLTVSSGQLRVVPSTGYAEIRSIDRFDLTGSSIGIELIQRQGGTAANTAVYLTAFLDDNNWFELNILGNNLVSRYSLAGAYNSTSLTFNAVNQRYWRLREASGTIYWETSADRRGWAIQRSVAAPFKVTALNVLIGAGCDGAETNFSPAIFDNLNYVNKTETLVDTFTTADTAKWAFTSNMTVSAGRLVGLPASNFGGIYSAQVYDLTSSYVLAEVVRRQNQGNGTTQLILSVKDLSNSNKLEILVQGTQLLLRRSLSNVDNDTSITYDSIAHRWWRVREYGGTIYWETSPDSITWTIRRQLANPFVITQVGINITAGFSGSEPVLVAGIVDNFNAVLPRAPAIFYVSNGGSDAADGLTASTPWQTIDRVNNQQLVLGDTVRFNGGQTFTGGLSIGSTELGSAANPITFESYGTGRATITNTTSAFTVTNTAGLRIRNLILLGGTGAASAGAGIAISSSATYRLDYLSLDNVDISAFRAGVELGASALGFADVDINNCDLRANRDHGLWMYGPTFNATTPNYAHANVRVGSSRLYGNTGYANNPARSGTGMTVSSVDTMTVEDCVAYGNGAASTGSGGGSQGYYFYDSRALAVQRSVAYAHRDGGIVDGIGFNFNSNVSDSVLQHNIAYDNDGCGYHFFALSDNNRHVNNVMRFNIGWGNATKNIWRGEVWIEGFVSNLAAFNNTIVAVDNGNGSPCAFRFTSAKSAVTVRNNVIVSGNGPTIQANAAMTTSIVLFQGNVYRPLGTNLADVQGTGYSTIEAFRSATSQETIGSDATGLMATPGLVAPGATPTVTVAGTLTPANGLKLQPGSIATAAGLDLAVRFGTSIGTRDFFGNVLTGPFSAGAYEATSSEVPNWMLDSIAMS